LTRVQKTGPLITVALLSFASLIVLAAIIFVPTWIKPSLSGADLNAVPPGQIRIALQQAQAQLQNSIRSTLLQALGGFLVVAGAVATWRQVRISREGQITDRLTHAIDQLGNDKVDVRIGGIYALERLAKDSTTDRLAIVEILAAFIRTHAAWPAGYWSHPDQHPTPDVDETMLWLTDRTPDVRTAVLVLGRYPHEGRVHPGTRQSRIHAAGASPACAGGRGRGGGPATMIMPVAEARRWTRRGWAVGCGGGPAEHKRPSKPGTGPQRVLQGLTEPRAGWLTGLLLARRSHHPHPGRCLAARTRRGPDDQALLGW
jgi:hypothetical protein